MGQARGFSEFQKFLNGSKNIFRGAILDSNILVALTYEVKRENEVTEEFLELLKEESFRFFATVTTRAEILDFHRRLIMTERLLDLADSTSKIKVTERAKAAIQTQKASMRSREKKGSDAVFTDREIKEIKKAFSAGPHSGFKGWLALCEIFLSTYLRKVDENLLARGIEYLSPNESSKKELYIDKPAWNSAISIAEKSALSFSDSLILNTLQSTRIPFAVSLDFDFGYAVLSDSLIKDVFIPDSNKSDYRYFQFPVPPVR